MRKVYPFRMAALTAMLACAGTQQVSALTKEQAVEQCRNTVGRPIVQACMRGGGGDRESCRAKASPKVKDCVVSALNAANGRANVPVAVEKEQGPSADILKQAEALPTGFVAPPRTITDITAILDSEKPDPNKIAHVKAAADATPPDHSSREKLAWFYYDRGHARALLGRLNESLADAEKALEVAHGAVSANMIGRLEQFLGLQYSAAGDPKKSLEIFERQLRDTNTKGAKGYMFGANYQISLSQLQLGDLSKAETYLNRSLKLIREARTSGLPGWRTSYAQRGQSWESTVEINRATILEARGQYSEAEKSYRVAEMRRRASIEPTLRLPNPPPRGQMLAAVDLTILGQARMKARQGRFAEAEADARRALLSRLKEQGKYSPNTPQYIMVLANVLVEQGRYGEAEKLVRVAIEVNRAIGVPDHSQGTAQMLSSLGGVLTLQHKQQETTAVYAELDKAMANWEPRRREVFDLDGSRIFSLYASGEVDRGVKAAEALLKYKISHVGEKAYDTATARGVLAIGYMKADRDADAVREFRIAIPMLMTTARENADDENTTGIAARSARLRDIVESYIALRARGGASKGEDAAVETFALADSIRGHSVQQALAASSTRMLTKDPDLANLVREEQDLSKQVNAQLGTLNNVLALPAGDRNEDGVKALNASIAKLRADRDRKRAEVAKRFPEFVSLVDPKAPTVNDIQATLKPDEALLSFYLGRDSSFVWVVPKTGKVAFAAIPASSGDIETKIRKLRESLEPQAAMISDIPPFDLTLAYDLYSLLLKPVEAGWKPAKNLIVVTNGALGLLPLSLLPTASAKAVDGSGPLFAGYRDVPWLARSHAVTMVPSAGAIRTLRQTPPGSDKRERLIGFGDPIFSKEQEAKTAQQGKDGNVQVAMATTRGMPLKRRSSPKLEGVDSAELALLPALPDTAEELKLIALALEADPSKVLHLGKKADENVVKTMDLSRYKTIVFATHGLVPGELNGLTQPALALSAPDVTGVAGDGLLTMEEILALKLDADWVVLSACNTGTGAGAGAEAASGLGRAFFYAGTRALLVTNWSVHSQSARDLISDMFRRQTADSKLTRSESLRQAMMALMDGPGYVDANGKTLFAYAHPLFWAPYSIIGDGGI